MTVSSPDLKEERRLRSQGYGSVAGLDEVGRGAWAGPLTVGVVVLAPASGKLSPDIAVRVDADTDRRAYDALEKGASLASLLSDNPDKPRIDEAYLEREHLSDGDAPDVASDKPSPPSPLVDSVLQRAVQLHRGLLALKRI